MNERPELALTPREEQVFAFVAAGLQDKQIAHEMGISPQTLKHYIHALRIKKGFATRTIAALAWYGADTSRALAAARGMQP